MVQCLVAEPGCPKTKVHHEGSLTCKSDSLVLFPESASNSFRWIGEKKGMVQLLQLGQKNEPLDVECRKLNFKGK